MIKEHECLYNNKNKFYYIRNVKEEICEYMLREMQKDKPTIQIDDIRRKIKILRTQFARENRLLLLARAEGRCYRPKLWCYDKLLFLEKHTTMIPIYTKQLPVSYDDTNTFSDDETINCDDNDENSLLMDIYKKEEVFPNDSDENILKYEEIPQQNEIVNDDNSKEPMQKNQDEVTEIDKSDPKKMGKYDWLGELVVSQIEDIDLTNRCDFVWDIQCLVRKYLIKPAKLANEQTPTTSDTANGTKDITFHKGSNISVNVNFL